MDKIDKFINILLLRELKSIFYKEQIEFQKLVKSLETIIEQHTSNQTDQEKEWQKNVQYQGKRLEMLTIWNEIRSIEDELFGKKFFMVDIDRYFPYNKDNRIEVELWKFEEEL